MSRRIALRKNFTQLLILASLCCSLSAQASPRIPKVSSTSPGQLRLRLNWLDGHRLLPFSPDLIVDEAESIFRPLGVEIQWKWDGKVRAEAGTKLRTLVFGDQPLENQFRIGDWQVQPHLNRLVTAGNEVRIEPKAMQVLVYFAENAGKVISKKDVLREV